jgi:hypothetical protein
MLREHAAKMKELKADADEQIKRSKAHQEALIEQHRLHRQLLREEMMEARRQKDRVELEHRRNYRAFLKGLGSTMSNLDRQWLLDDLMESTPDPNHPTVRQVREWVNAVCQREGIDIRYCALPQLRNGSAVRDARYINLAEITSECLAAVAAHEATSCIRRLRMNAPKD